MCNFSKIWSKEKENYFLKLENILGFTPKNINPYTKRFHASISQSLKMKRHSINFERLEFLGDLSMIRLCHVHLYEKLAQDNEGKLTRMKSKIVSREKLNLLEKRLNLLDHLDCTGNKENFGDDIYGNILEALIGAVFIDKGYEAVKK